MSNGLDVSRLIKVTVTLSPTAAQFANFNSLLIFGSTNVIDVSERIRSYNSMVDVGGDFGTTDPEYLAAQLYFSQTPQPTQLYIGRWAQAATAGVVHGGILTTAQQAIANFTVVTTGGFKVTIDGVLKTLTALNFSGASTLSGVAGIITTALSTAGSCIWDGEKFNIISATTGATSTVTYATAPGSGTDISALLKLTAALASPPVAGIVAETALAGVGVLANVSSAWYGITVVSSSATDADLIAISGYIEASTRKRVHGISTTNTQVLSSAVTTDVASLAKAAGYTRTFVQYSQIPYVAASFFGRALTTDFTQNNSTITLMYKQEPGVVAETLTASQADTLIAKRCNFFVNFNNGTAILEDGVMSGSAYFDEIHGIDWFQNAVQTNVWNLLYTSGTKIPQTDAGQHQIGNIIEATCEAAVNNGLAAPGTWTSGGFGTLKQGDYLPKGYYVYVPPVSTQADADRQARKSVPIKVALKFAGATHSVDIAVDVNR